MEVVRDSKLLKDKLIEGSALTVGTFDGVHLGHRSLIEHTVAEGHRRGLKSLAITFEPHPIYVLRPEIKVERIAMPDEKIDRLSNFGLDYLLILDFNTRLANYEAIRFFKELLIGDLNAKFIALGYNHTFGKNRQGDLDFLKGVAPEYNCDVSAVEPFYFEDQPISSSRIRKAVKAGEIEIANRMLVRKFTLPGRIVRGKGLGHKIGYPTVNAKIEDGKLMPKAGVYAATCIINGREIQGMMYIHPEPKECELEVNLFDFNRDVYETQVVVQPLKYTREAVKFDGLNDLIEQLKEDEIEIKHFFEIN